MKTPPKNPQPAELSGNVIQSDAAELEAALVSNTEYQKVKLLQDSLEATSLGITEATKSLTKQQRAFLDKYSTLQDVRKACEAADLGKHPTAHSRYRKLLATPEARLYLEKISNLGVVQSGLDTQEIIEKFRMVFTAALADGDYKAANEAAKLLGMYKGMFVERKEVNNTTTTHTSGDKPSEIRGDINKFKDILAKASKIKVV